MSVISRMLRDLEARDARPEEPRDADGGPRHFRAQPARPPRHAPRARRAVPALVALVLAALAAALWWQRAPQVWAMLAPYLESATEQAPAASPQAQPKAPAARLADVRYGGSGSEATLTLVIEGEPREQPGYARRGRTLAVRIPAPAADLDLGAPPDDQGVFRSVALQSDGNGAATLRLQVGADARFDLERTAERLILTGRLPAPAEPAPAEQEARSAEMAPKPERAATASGSAATATPDANDDSSNDPARAPSAGQGENPAPEAVAAAPDHETASSGDADAPPGEAESADSAASSDSGEPGESNGGMRKADRSTPEVRAQRRYREARTTLRQGEVAEARRSLHRALELDPGLHSARDLLATLYRRVGDGEAARDVLAQGIERSPRRLAYAKPYARLLVDAGDLDRAAQVLERAAAAGREDADYQALRAAVAQRRGEHERAAAAYTRALELDGGNGRWWLGLGVALSAADLPGEAAAAFREAQSTGTLTQRLDSWARSRVEALEARAE